MVLLLVVLVPILLVYLIVFAGFLLRCAEAPSTSQPAPVEASTEDSGPRLEGNGGSQPEQQPYRRVPIPIDERVIPVPIEVAVSEDLKPHGPSEEGGPRTYGWFDTSSRTEDHVLVRVGISNGFGGPLAEITFDPENRTARACAAVSYDIPPFHRYWSALQGTVRISSWALDSWTLVEIDIQGIAEGRDWSLNLCTRLEGVPFRSLRSEAQFNGGQFGLGR